MDRFSRWLEITLIKGDKEDGGLKAENTLYKFKKRVVDYHGLSQVVLTDGSKMAKRIIRTITEKLQHYVGAGGRDWGDYAHSVQTSLNSHMAWGPKMSPFFLGGERERARSMASCCMAWNFPLLNQSTLSTASSKRPNREKLKEMPRKEMSNLNNKTREGQKNTSRWLPAVGSLVMV
jgi:hypothetical protein